MEEKIKGVMSEIFEVKEEEITDDLKYDDILSRCYSRFQA